MTADKGKWFGDEAFWQAFFPVIFPEERFDQAEEQVDRLLSLLHFSGRTVLDLACGPGRHSILLASRGFDVTGVDLSPFLLGEAQKRAEAAGVEVEWIQADMREFSQQGAFDLCLNMFTSFGYFQSRKDDQKVLRNIHESLTPAGVCLIDVTGKEVLARNFKPTSSQELEDGTLMIERRRILEDWSRVRNEWILLKDGRAREFHSEHAVYSAQELKTSMLECGFAEVRIYGDLDGHEYGPEASRLVAVGRVGR